MLYLQESRRRGKKQGREISLTYKKKKKKTLGRTLLWMWLKETYVPERKSDKHLKPEPQAGGDDHLLWD